MATPESVAPIGASTIARMGERIDFAYAGDDPEWESYVERSQIALAVLEGDAAEAIGVAFTLVAKENLPGDGNWMAGPLNLGRRIRPDLPHRARVVVDVGGQVLSNVFPVDAFPADPRRPWLSGGSDFRRRCGDSVESGAHYFLTPHPGHQKVLIAVAYPECGMEMASIEIAPDIFTI
ncbi:hypothetical protein [Speluncibacter jeojiensis]|uniref:Uncharacterized protein n=1 Tax=Speluncibacter jeojiensis TaxID=2710754 RepID=A0A9X4LWX5_9ACTN|nr:hypothetical protein [Corynebacteriales bacterium D3-21]